MNLLTIILTSILFLCSLILILVILFQTGRSANSSAVSGGGSGSNYYNKNKSGSRDAILQRLTIIVGIVFALIIILINAFEIFL